MRHALHPATARIAGPVLATAALLAARDRDERPNAPGPTPVTVVADSLSFTRADSTVVVMGTTPLVCCGLYDPSFVNERAIRVVLYDPANHPSKVPPVSMFVARDISCHVSGELVPLSRS